MSDNNAYLFTAYVVTWVVLMAYGVRLQRVTRRANEEYESATHESGEAK